MRLFLINFENTGNKIENNKLQKEYSKFFANYILKRFYGLDNVFEKDKDNRPFVKNPDIHTTISHSANLVAILFDENTCGVDIEFIKKRNYKKILKRFNIKKDLSLIEFYQWWTLYEAEFKSKIKMRKLSFIYKNFVCSISSLKQKYPEIFEITLCKNSIKNINIKKLINSQDIVHLNALRN